MERRHGLDGGEILREQDLLERFGVKNIFHEPGVVPSVQHQQIQAVVIGGNKGPVTAPVGGPRTVGVGQHIGVAQPGAGRLG